MLSLSQPHTVYYQRKVTFTIKKTAILRVTVEIIKETSYYCLRRNVSSKIEFWCCGIKINFTLFYLKSGPLWCSYVNILLSLCFEVVRSQSMKLLHSKTAECCYSSELHKFLGLLVTIFE